MDKVNEPPKGKKRRTTGKKLCDSFIEAAARAARADAVRVR